VSPSRRELLGTAAELGARFEKRAEQHDREASFPFDDFADLRDAGFLALCIPAAYGGLGADFSTYGRVARELGRYAPATALSFNMHCVTMLVTGQIADDLTWTAEEQEARERRRQALYAGVIEHGQLHAQPFSEGHAGGALAGYTTTAERVDGGYLVSGRKIFASLADAADVHNVVAVSPGDPRIRLLGVRKDASGLRIDGDWDPLGMRATSSRTLLMERVFVPTDHEWLPLGGFDQVAERWPHLYLTLSFTYVGLTLGVLDAARRYLRESGRTGNPVKQHGWAEMQLAAEQADALMLRAVDEAAVDPEPDQVRRAWAAMVTAMETAPAVAATALRICGGRALLKPQPLERLYRDARCGATMLPWSVDACLERLGRSGLVDEEGEVPA
jgi:alkylation response protein AidB-like acyl-CoA dehydrogenase